MRPYLQLDNVFVHFKNWIAEDVFSHKFKAYKQKTYLKNDDVDVKIGGLDFSGVLPLFMAPEMLKGKSDDSKINVWSLGTMFFEIITGFFPFTGNNREEIEQAIEKGDYWIPKDIKLSLEGLSFLNYCLQYNP